jgi:hypothetical protein
MAFGSAPAPFFCGSRAPFFARRGSGVRRGCIEKLWNVTHNRHTATGGEKETD